VSANWRAAGLNPAALEAPSPGWRAAGFTPAALEAPFPSGFDNEFRAGALCQRITGRPLSYQPLMASNAGYFAYSIHIGEAQASWPSFCRTRT
jgi:hypothetical protein